MMSNFNEYMIVISCLLYFSLGLRFGACPIRHARRYIIFMVHFVETREPAGSSFVHWMQDRGREACARRSFDGGCCSLSRFGVSLTTIFGALSSNLIVFSCDLYFCAGGLRLANDRSCKNRRCNRIAPSLGDRDLS